MPAAERGKQPILPERIIPQKQPLGIGMAKIHILRIDKLRSLRIVYAIL